MLDDCLVRYPRFQQCGWQRIHFGIALIADDQPLVGVEHAQALRHVVQGGVKSDVLGAQLRGDELALAQVKEMGDGNDQSDRRQRHEETERDCRGV